MVLDNAPVNRPQTPAQRAEPTAPRDTAGSEVIGLSFSGGGLRAAAFSLGALQALQGGDGRPSLLSDVNFITAVSGGSLTAAYYGLHGSEGLAPFRRDVLSQNLELQMRLSAWSPANWLRLVYGGGINDRSNLADLLDRRVFHGATFADLYRRGKPNVWINATDLFNRLPFSFTPPVFAALCSDLSQLPLAEAVHASMAVPIVFAPVVLQTYPRACSGPLPHWVSQAERDPEAPQAMRATASAVQNYRNPEVMRFVKLVDGGVTDNYGLSSVLISRAVAATPYGPFSAGDAVRMRRMLFLVVDAGRAPSGDWARTVPGPPGLEMALLATDTAIDAASRLAYDAFGDMVRQWHDAIVTYRCQLDAGQVAALRRGATGAWRCRDLRFDVGLVRFADLAPARAQQLGAIPTRLALSPAEIDAAVSAGRDAVLANPAYRRFVADLPPACALKAPPACGPAGRGTAPASPPAPAAVAPAGPRR